MDTVLTIEGDEAISLAERLAALTGQPVSVAVTRALAEQVAREQRRRDADVLAAELVAIGQRCAALLVPPLDSADHADLYGDDGLPA